MMGNYHVRCGAGEKPEVLAPEAYLSLFKIPDMQRLISGELYAGNGDKSAVRKTLCTDHSRF